MTDALTEALSKYRPATGMDSIVRAHSEMKTGLTPETLAEKYAEEGQPLFVADYLPFTNFDPGQKAELLIQAHLGQAERFSQQAVSCAAYPVLRDDYNQRASAERQQADHLAKILSQLASSSG